MGGAGGVTVIGSVGGSARNTPTTKAAAPKPTTQSRVRPQSAGAVTISQRIAHRNFRTPEMIVNDAQNNMSGLQAKEEGGQTSTPSSTGKAGGASASTEGNENNSKNGNGVDTDTNAVAKAGAGVAGAGGDRVYTQSHSHTTNMVTVVSKPKVVNAEALTNLSSKFCSSSELSYLQSIMSSGNLKGRSTTEFYTIGKVVGVGSFAKVRLAWHKLTGQAIAIKTYEKSKMKDASHLRRVQQEIKVMEVRGGTASRCMERIAVAR